MKAAGPETPPTADAPPIFAIGVLALLCAAFGAFSVFYATPWGLGLQLESIAFIESADPAQPPAQVTPEPIRWRMDPGLKSLPAYGALIARVDPRVIAPEDSMRPVHALGFALNALLLAALAFFLLGRSALAAAGCALLVVVSVDLIHAHALLGAEIWLILAGYSALGAAALYSARGGAAEWAACAVLLAVALLLDFKALAFFGAVAAARVCPKASAGRTRGILGAEDERAILFAALLPLGAWLLWNYYATEFFFGRNLIFYPFNPRALWTGADTISGWLLPDKVPFKVRAGALAAAAAAWAAAAVIQKKSSAGSTAISGAPEFGSELHRLLVFLPPFYAVIVLAASFVFPRGAYQLDQRTLAPLLPAVILLAARTLQRLIGAPGLPRNWRIIGAVLIALFVLSHAARAVRFVILSHRDGRLLYGTPEWRSSNIIELARRLPKHATIYTNDYRPLYALARRRSERIPAKTDAATGQPNPDFYAQTKVMGVQLRETSGVIVYWADPKGIRPYIPTEADLGSILPLEKAAESELGAVYAIKPSE